MDALIFIASSAAYLLYHKTFQEETSLLRALQTGTSLNAMERVCLVDQNNKIINGGILRKDMRLHNMWHRATYVLVRHEPSHLDQHGTHPSDVYVLVQTRSKQKDYYPGRLDPTPGGVVAYNETYRENAIREMKEEMGIDVEDSIQWLFTFPYEDERVRVWGDFYECTYRGAMKDLRVQKEEVQSIERMTLERLKDRIDNNPEDFMPDACYAMRLYFQRRIDLHVSRKMLKGYSSSDLNAYAIRPKPKAIFFDCDDCLYFDGWNVANLLTANIDKWCIKHGLRPGQAYELYKQYGTALRGLLAEGYLEETEEAIDQFLEDVHDIPIEDLIPRDDKLRNILSKIDPTIPKYIFTASVSHHAIRCIKALGIDDLFVDVIDCKKCNLETKHSHHSFRLAMEIARVDIPELCLFFDDSVKNIRAANEMGWRSVLVGRINRDHGTTISSEHAELEIDRIHDIINVLPELFDH